MVHINTRLLVSEPTSLRVSVLKYVSLPVWLLDIGNPRVSAESKFEFRSLFARLLTMDDPPRPYARLAEPHHFDLKRLIKCV